MSLTDGAKTAAKRAAGMPAATVVGFWRGLSYPFRGARLVFVEHPGLVRFWGVPILATAALLVGVVWAGWAWHQEVADLVWSEPGATEGPDKVFPSSADKGKPSLDKALTSRGGFWSGLSVGLHDAFEILVLLVLWVLGLVLVVFLSNVIAAPFNDLLSEEVEHRVVGTEGPDFALRVLVRDTVRTVALEALKMGLYLAVMVPLYLVSLLVPVAGQVVYSVFGFLFTACYFAIDYVDWPASRRNRGVRYRFGMLRQHPLPMVGFGTGVWLFLFIPLVNLLFMPAAVAGGTLLFLDLEGETGRSATGAAPPEGGTAPAG